jgi:hypothetical protein
MYYSHSTEHSQSEDSSNLIEINRFMSAEVLNLSFYLDKQFYQLR